ncbi:MAG: hypothetical protein EOL86_03150 [Deltaproteobacteria bacterium]|nr:hypothetical protein [Deltaproteobacteria bacterium]
MRSFLIDEISPENLDKVEAWLKEQELGSAIDKLYHFPLPPKLLTPMQQEHATACGPFYMAVETGHDWIKLELLVRAKNILRCACIAYATPEQQEHMTSYLESLLTDLGIPL